MSIEPLNIARRKLNDVLNEKSTKYFSHMKQWFRMKLTKEEFDAEARKLLSSDQVHYHNEFLLALLNKVEGLTEASILSIAQEKASSHNRNSRRHKRSSRTSEKSNFEPVDLLEYLSPNSPPGAGSDGVKYAAQVTLKIIYNILDTFLCYSTIIIQPNIYIVTIIFLLLIYKFCSFKEIFLPDHALKYLHSNYHFPTLNI